MSDNLKKIEEEYLSCLMHTDDAILFSDLLALVGPNDFTTFGFGQIYSAIQEAHDQTGGKNKSPATVWSAVLNTAGSKSLDSMGIGIEDLSNIYDNPINFEVGIIHASVISKGAQQRRFQRVWAQMMSASANGVSVEDQIAQADLLMAEAIDGTGPRAANVGDVNTMMWDAMTGKRPLPMFRIKSYNPVFDKYSGGLKTGNIYYITAPTHHGKTTLLRATMAEPAYHDRKKVVCVLFALEETKDKASMEFWSYWTGPHAPWVLEIPEPSERICVTKDRFEDLLIVMSDPEEDIDPMSQEEQIEIANALRISQASSLMIVDSARNTAQISSVLRSIARVNPGKVIVAGLDYVQLLEGTREGTESVHVISDATSFFRASMPENREMNGRGLWIVTSQLRGGSVDTEDITLGTSPGDVYEMDGMKGSSALSQSGDLIVGTLMPEITMSDAARRGDSLRFNVTIFKNKVSSAGLGNLFLRREKKTGRIFA